MKYKFIVQRIKINEFSYFLCFILFDQEYNTQENKNVCCFSTMQNTESGRKLNQAMASTGRAVATTGKAVGKVA